MIGAKKWTVQQLGTLLRLENEEALEVVRKAVEKTNGNVLQAARDLGFSRPYTLLDWFYTIPALKKISRQTPEEARQGNMELARGVLDEKRRRAKRSKKRR